MVMRAFAGNRTDLPSTEGVSLALMAESVSTKEEAHD